MATFQTLPVSTTCLETETYFFGCIMNLDAAENVDELLALTIARA